MTRTGPTKGVPMLPATSNACNPQSLSPPVQTQPSRLISCNAGLRVNDKRWLELWVRSPRTGTEIVISELSFDRLRQTAPRLIGRVATARSSGCAFVEVTVADLQAVAELRTKLDR